MKTEYNHILNRRKWFYIWVVTKLENIKEVFRNDTMCQRRG